MAKIMAACVLTVALACGAKATQAQQTTPRWLEVSNQYYANVASCWDRYAKKQIKSFKAATACGDGGAIAAFEQAGYPAMDVVRYLIAQNTAIAERVDAKKITPSEGAAQRADVEMRVTAEIQRRNAAIAADLRTRQAAEQETSALQARMEADAAAIARSRAQSQAQIDAAQAQIDAARQAALLRFAAGMGQPTYGGFAGSLNNGFNAAARIQLAPAQTFVPSQTICQRFGNQVICNTQ